MLMFATGQSLMPIFATGNFLIFATAQMHIFATRYVKNNQTESMMMIVFLKYHH